MTSVIRLMWSWPIIPVPMTPTRTVTPGPRSPYRSVPHGEIRSDWYASKSLGTLRRLTVYTPHGYDGAIRGRLPVLYLFHGANADETAWTRFGHVNYILDNLLAAGKVKPFLVVMPFGYGIPPVAPPPPEPTTPRYSAATSSRT